MTGARAIDETAPDSLTRMELVISYVLRAGVLLSAAIILGGLVAFAVMHWTGYARILPHHLPELLSFHPRRGPGYFPTALGEVVGGAFAGRPWAIIGLGVIALIATPVVRVLLAVFFFLVQRDWLYVGFTVFVLVVLVASFLSGAG